jgi:hypothetical protein
MAQNPPSPQPFPSPKELKSKITEFMKQNFGDRVSTKCTVKKGLVTLGNFRHPGGQKAVGCSE